MNIIIKIICILLLIYSIKYVVDRIKGKKENIGLDNTYIINIIALILIIIFI